MVKVACMERGFLTCVYSCINTLGKKNVRNVVGVGGSGTTYLTKILFFNTHENISDIKLKQNHFLCSKDAYGHLIVRVKLMCAHAVLRNLSS